MAFPDTLLSNQWGSDTDPPSFIAPSTMNTRVDTNLNALATRLAANKLAGMTASFGSGMVATPPAGAQLQVFLNAVASTTFNSGAAITVTYSGSFAFPNGTAWVFTVPFLGATSVRPVAASPVPTTTSFGAVAFNGSTQIGTSVNFMYLAVGW